MANDGSSTSQNKETVTLRLPSGEMVDAIVPAGFSDEDLKSYVRMKQPDLFGAPAGVPKPSTQMSSEGPIASGLTSFESRLSEIPTGLWQQSFFGEIGNPKVKALHEARDLAIQKATQQPGIMPGIQALAPMANPIAKTDAGTPAERVDVGATAANLLPYLLAARGAIEQTPTSKLTSPIRAAVGGANKVLKNYPKTIGAAAGGAIGQMTHAPMARELGAGIGAAVGSEVLPRVRIPGEGFGLPNRVTGGPEKAPQYIAPSKVSTTPPESVSKSSQLQQSKALQNIPVRAVQDKSTILPRMQAIAQQIQQQGSVPAEAPGPSLRIAGKDVPANINLAPALQKSLPANRIQGKIMQVVRREGTLGMDRLMEAPELQGISRKQVEDAAMGLGKSEKLWVPTKEADAHGPAGIISLAIRKK